MAESSVNPPALPSGSRLALALLAVLTVAAAATALPLLIYSLSLAAFGLAHVLSELRYVDTRFGPRVGFQLRLALGGLLAAVFALRALTFAGVSLPQPKLIELGVVIVLCASVLPTLLSRSRAAGVGAGLLVVAFAALAWRWPLETFLALSFSHNLTPVGFIAERLRGQQRALALTACAFVFVLVPLLIASGAALGLAAHWGLLHPDASLLPGVDDLGEHLRVYVPQTLLQHPDRALALFSAATYLQCMHYAAVIYVLPSLDGPDGWTTPRNVFPWPGRRTFVLLLLGAGLFVGVGFCVDFKGARGGYGSLAAVHAWVELPLLLLALGVPAGSVEG